MSTTTDVLVIGAGPVGLAVAAELGYRGANAIIVDPITEAVDRQHPRARLLNLRSVEHLRRWGISDEMRDRSEFDYDWASDVYFLTGLDGHLLHRFEDAFLSAPTDTDLYPEPTIQILQWQTEEVLRRFVDRLPSITTMFGRTVVDVRLNDDGTVTATLEDSGGQTSEIRAKYAVGADGGRSLVRSSQGFVMEGSHHLANCLQVLFSSPNFYDVTRLGPALQYWLLNDRFSGFLQTVSPNGDFLLSLHKLDQGQQITADEATATLKAALGDKVEFTINGFDRWAMRSEIAGTYRRGPFFVVGDAARQHPTYGGHGMNVGLSDAVDLGWKLAAVLEGQAPDGLLDSFTEERRPVGYRVLQVATEQFKLAPKDLVRAHLDEPTAEGEQARRELGRLIATEKKEQFRSIGAQLGYAYSTSPLVEGDGQGQDWDVNVYTPVAEAGAIAPHAWVDGESLYDRFDMWFTVLAFGDDSVADATELLAGAEALGIKGAVLHLEDPGIRQKYGARLAVVRPDQHLAWVGQEIPGETKSFWKKLTGWTLVPAEADVVT